MQLKKRIISCADKIKSGHSAIYQVHVEQSSTDAGIRKVQLGKAGPAKEKVVMMLGATGSGKTTVINGIFNYVVGVEWNDLFRFRLVDESSQTQGRSQAHSQTRFITAYTLHHQDGFKVPYTITIVDTPGFGDTEGMTRDKEITKLIERFFKTEGQAGIDHIDAVGFVVQAALARLTPNQQYIFDSILKLFGKDIEGNIFSFLTFADGKPPEALNALKAANISSKNNYELNNAALFPDKNDAGNTDYRDSGFNKLYWDMTNKGFKQFMKDLSRVDPKSLVLTKDVLKHRSKLEIYLKGIQEDIDRALIKREQIEKEAEALKLHENDIEKNKDFTYETVEEKKVIVHLGDEWAVICSRCKRTCHNPCSHLFVYTCDCIGFFGGCNVCSNCDMGSHEFSKFCYKLESVTITRTKEDIKQKYEEAMGKAATVEEMIEKAKKDLEASEETIVGYINKATLAMEALNEIALKPDALSSTDYVDIMIEKEKSEKKSGFKQRVGQLYEVKKMAETMKKVKKGSIKELYEVRQQEEVMKRSEESGVTEGEAPAGKKRFFQTVWKMLGKN